VLYRVDETKQDQGQGLGRRLFSREPDTTGLLLGHVQTVGM
jgi:hypothetical protein